MSKHCEREHDKTMNYYKKNENEIYKEMKEEKDLPSDVDFDELQREKQTNKNGKFIAVNGKNSLYEVFVILNTIPENATDPETVTHYKVLWKWLDLDKNGNEVSAVTNEPVDGVFLPSATWIVWSYWKYIHNVNYKSPWLAKLKSPSDLGAGYKKVARKSLKKAAKKLTENLENDLNSTLLDLTIHSDCPEVP